MKKILLKNAYLYTMAGTEIKNGDLLIKGDKIAAVGEELQVDGAETIDLSGQYVTPGFINAHCHIGMFEDSLGFEGDDGNEMTDPVTPQLRAIDALFPTDRTFDEALAAGVTTAVTGPGSANVIGGQFAAVKTYGRTIEEKLLRAPVAMKIAFGENPKRVYNNQKKSPTTRMATAAILRESLYKAKEYIEKKQAAAGDQGKMPAFDLKWESLLPVLNNEIPLKAHAHRADDIMTAIRIAEEFKLRITLDHCTEGHLIADLLAARGYPAIVGPSFGDRSKVELRNLTFETPGILSKAGVKVAIMTDAPVIPLQYLPLCAKLAVRNGMEPEEALKAITINPAEIVGLSQRVGSLEVGKDADLVVFDQNPLAFETNIMIVFVNGQKVYRT
ncbi:MAG TPA: amidohydrolase [Firmicutes bacterium]|jgi:imidazolonepropionase-like amidohydrolase|nr:amidohydrolase [Bacillota bacterium]